jgi:hypothetical protein
VLHFRSLSCHTSRLFVSQSFSWNSFDVVHFDLAYYEVAKIFKSVLFSLMVFTTEDMRRWDTYCEHCNKNHRRLTASLHCQPVLNFFFIAFRISGVLHTAVVNTVLHFCMHASFSAAEFDTCCQFSLDFIFIFLGSKITLHDLHSYFTVAIKNIHSWTSSCFEGYSLLYV